MKFNKFAWCLVLLLAASTCFAQMYTVTDLGTLGGTTSDAAGINASGQVVGNSGDHAFRTAPNSPMNPNTNDLGPFVATAINASGQVAGYYGAMVENRYYPDVGPQEYGTDRAVLNGADLGSFCPHWDPQIVVDESEAYGVNDSGQLVGWSYDCDGHPLAFRTAPSSPLNFNTDSLGSLACLNCVTSWATGINSAGQVVGYSLVVPYDRVHAFRTAPNSTINSAMDDLGTLLGGKDSYANAVNTAGQVVGWSQVTASITRPCLSCGHAFRTAPNSTINSATDDLGTLGGSWSAATGINASGQVVGYANLAGDTVQHAFLHSGGVMYDLNDLIPPDSGWQLSAPGAATYSIRRAIFINDSGQIAGTGVNPNGLSHAFLLAPIYKAFVQQPINADGSSVFNAHRGVLPVKFTLTQYSTPTCNLLPATIAITEAAAGSLSTIDESDPNFQITGCQYHYNLATGSLGVGTYRVDISINGMIVGHAVFVLK